MMRPLVVLFAVTMVSCAPATPAPDGARPAAVAPGDTTLVGTVRVVGSAPVNIQVVLQPGSGQAVRIEGPLEAEIRRLSGAEVAVEGQANGDAIAVSRYEVRSVDGAPVQMGVVERTSAGTLQLRKPDGEVAYLTGATNDLRVGQKVWVQGPAAVVVQSYGVLTP